MHIVLVPGSAHAWQYGLLHSTVPCLVRCLAASPSSSSGAFPTDAEALLRGETTTVSASETSSVIARSSTGFTDAALSVSLAACSPVDSSARQLILGK